ncbi:MAG: hypothetical protein ABGX16_14210 [Pirellulales bacterium]
MTRKNWASSLTHSTVVSRMKHIGVHYATPNVSVMQGRPLEQTEAICGKWWKTTIG